MASKKVPINVKLVKAITDAVKKRLLDCGVEPGLINAAVIYETLRDYNKSVEK